MKLPHATPIALALAAALALGACSRGGDDEVAAEDGTVVAADEAGAYADDDAMDQDAAAETVEAPALRADDLEALARGIAAENEYLEQATQRLREADGQLETLAALADAGDEKLDEVGAGAAGMDVDDFVARKEALFDLLGQIEMRAMLAKQFGDMDTSDLDPEMAAQARRNAEEMMAGAPDPYLGMEPALAEALHAEEARLAELRSRQVALLFSMIKGG